METINKSVIKVSPDHFNAVLSIVSAYGSVLETSSISMEPCQSVTKLPCSKDTIKKVISFLYVALTFENVRQWVREHYPEHAENILSNKYYLSLRDGYLYLPTFLSEKDCNVVLSFHRLIPDKDKLDKMILNSDHEDVDLLIDKMKKIPNECSEILKKIEDEQKEALVELNCLLETAVSIQIEFDKVSE